MADVEIKGKISVDAGQATKSTNDYIDALKAAKKAVNEAKIGSVEYKKAQEDLAKATKDLDNSVAQSGGSFGKLKGTLGGVVPGFEAASTGAAGLGKQLWLLVANPIGAIVAAFVVVFMLLYNVLKSFDPVMDAIERGFAAVKAVLGALMDTVLAVVTGTKNLKEAFTGLGSSIKQAATEAIEFTKIQQELDDLILKSAVNQAKYNRQINELILQSKDRTKTEAERVKLIDDALKIEEKAFSERKRIADDEVKIAQGAIMQGRNLTAAQKKQLLEKGVDYAIALKDTKRITDDEIKVLGDALAKQEDILNQSITLREKALNRKYALEDAATAKEADRQQKAKAAQEKADAEREKNTKIAKDKAAKEEIDRNNKIAANYKANQDEMAGIEAAGLELKKTADAEKQRLNQNEIDRGSSKIQIITTNYEAEKAIDNEALNNKRALGQAILSIASTLADELGKSTLAGKGIAIAGAIIDTWAAVTATLKGAAKTPMGGIPGYAIAQSIATGIAGLVSVKKIMSVQVPGKGAGSGASVSMPNLSAPSPLTPQPQRTSTSLDSNSIQGIGNAASGGVSRSFVLDADIANHQERAARIQRAARLA